MKRPIYRRVESVSIEIQGVRFDVTERAAAESCALIAWGNCSDSIPMSAFAQRVKLGTHLMLCVSFASFAESEPTFDT